LAANRDPRLICLVAAGIAAGALVAASVGCGKGQKPPKDDTPSANGAAAPATDDKGYHAAPIDPVALNGPIFENWPEPRAALVLTGDQLGYIEPCGCAGLENQKGGIARRHTFLRELTDREWPYVALDLGGFVRRFGRQAELQYQIASQAVQTMGYQAVGYGPKDLRLPAGLLAGEAGNEASRFVSANTNLFDQPEESRLVPQYRVTEAGGVRIGITSILGASQQAQVNNPEVAITDAEAALAEVVPQLEGQCDYRVLLAFATAEESIALAKKFPQFDVVVMATGSDEPPNEPAKVPGTDTLLIEVGHKGQYAIVLGLYGEKPPYEVRYQRVPLDARFVDSPEMTQLMVAYQGQLEELGLGGLGVTARAHPQAERLGEFVGAARCGECHKKAFATWSKTPHSHATESIAKANPPRLADPECLSCHVTGWSPQEYTPYEGGFVSLEETAHLTGNSCENCHGPGGAHVAAEDSRDIAHRQEMRQAMRQTKATVEQNVCRQCHDPDNSPAFNFDLYWPKVEHRGLD
jgi:hypothetical protein